MNDPQLEKIAAMITGMQLALVHIVTVLDAKGVASRAELAESFRETARRLPQDARNRGEIAHSLNHIADGIECSAPHNQDEVHRTVLRLINGSLESHPDNDSTTKG